MSRSQKSSRSEASVHVRHSVLSPVMVVFACSATIVDMLAQLERREYRDGARLPADP